MLELITGGLGFIGSIYTACAAQAGRRCIVVDHALDKQHLFSALPQVEVVIADLLACEQLADLIAHYQPQVVHHFAAHSAVGIVPDAVFEENSTALSNLLAALPACQHLSGVVFSSSCAVYGNSEGVSNEHAPLRPVSAYAQSKVACEQLLDAAARDTQLAAVALRYSNVAGAIDGYGERRARKTHLISSLIDAVLHDNEATIFGDDYPTPDGTCRRDYVHVRDVVAAHTLAVQNLQAGHCARFNICAGVSYSNLEVVRTVEQVSDKHLRLNLAARRKGDPAAVQLSHARATQALSYMPHHSELRTIVADTYRWLAANHRS